jgi:predicted ABC-type sugar transport system permease subunit
MTPERILYLVIIVIVVIALLWFLLRVVNGG